MRTPKLRDLVLAPLDVLVVAIGAVLTVAVLLFVMPLLWLSKLVRALRRRL